MPIATMKDRPLDFSFSGLKTAVLNHLNQERQKNREPHRADVAASLQRSVVTVLVDRAIEAAKITGQTKIVLAGGVAANGELRRTLSQAAAQANIKVLVPPPILCTDNGAMVACAGYWYLKHGFTAPLSLNAVANLPLDVI